jgi:hypothetical protein
LVHPQFFVVDNGSFGRGFFVHGGNLQDNYSVNTSLSSHPNAIARRVTAREETP